VSTLDELTVPKIEQTGPLAADEFVYVDISSVDNKTKRIVDPKRLLVTEAPSRARQRLRAGDVLVSMTRPNLNAVAMVPPELNGAIGSTGFHVLRAKDDVDPRWLFNAVQSRDFVQTMEDFVQGALYPAVRPKDIRGYELHAPPLAEQRRVLDEIEKQFSRLDRAVANLLRVKANLKRYKASVLKDAVEGRLVPTEAELARREGRSFETGEQLLQRIEGEQRRAWKGKGPFKSLTPLITSPSPDLPPGWIWATANQICGQITDGEHIQPRYQEVGQPMLTAKNVRDGYVTFDNAGLIAEVDFQNCLKRCAPIEGDILIVSVGATTGRSAIVGPAKPFALVRSVLLLKPLIPSRYLLSVIQSSTCQTYIQRASGSTAQAHLYIKDTRTLPIPIPPLAEQERIVAEVDRRLSLVQGVELAVDADLKRAQGLRQSVLSKSFMVL
jgi:type I restriction enzyme S subunit